MPSGGARKGAGRKPSPYKLRKQVLLSPENHNWLMDNGGITKVVNKLIEEKRCLK